MASRKLRITRPDRETGELIEETASASRYRPVLTRRPTPPPRPRYGCSQPGWLWNQLYDFRERMIAYWRAHAASLTRDERADLGNGKSSAVIRPAELKPTWEPGDVLEVVSNFTVVVATVKLLPDAGGWRTTFVLRDHRPYLLKRTPGSNTPPKTDSEGYPTALERRDIEGARIDGAYTSSSALAVPDAGEAIDDKLHRRIHGQREIAAATEGERARRRQQRMRQEERLVEARRKGWKSTVRYLERQLGRTEKGRRAA